MTAAAAAVQTAPTPLIDPRVAKLGGHRNSTKSTYQFPGMADDATWRRTEVHRHTRQYSCGLCGQAFAGPHAVYVHLAKRHPERFEVAT